MYKKSLLILITLIILPQIIILETSNTLSSEDIQITDISDKKSFLNSVNKSLSNASGIFTMNHGQLSNDNIRFYAQDGSVWFTDDGVWFEIREEIPIDSRESRVKSRESRVESLMNGLI